MASSELQYISDGNVQLVRIFQNGDPSISTSSSGYASSSDDASQDITASEHFDVPLETVAEDNTRSDIPFPS